VVPSLSPYGERLQVIVRATDYVLSPGEEVEEELHNEGMNNERIVAVGVCLYHATSNLSPGCLAFRSKPEHMLRGYKDMGKVPACRLLASQLI
jgi:UDP-N-acetylglucosamine 2-epimerase